MLKNYNICFLFFFLGLIPLSGHTQEQLKFGITKLEPKPIVDEDKIKCIVTPQITYERDNPTLLKVVFNAEWKDRNNVEFEGDSKNCYLYLIKNLDEISWNVKPSVSPVAVDYVEGIKKPIILFENQEEIISTSFNDPFLIIDKSSPVILYEIKGDVGNTFILKVDFTYVRSKKIRDFIIIKNWSFTIPSDIYELDICKEKEDQYSNTISNIKSPLNILYFSSQLEKTNIEIHKLKSEFSEYLIEIQSLNKLKDKISNDEQLENCQEIKNELLINVDKLIPSDLEIKNIIQKIAEIKNSEKPEEKVVKVEEMPKEKTYERNLKKDNSKEIGEVVTKYNKILSDLSNEFVDLQDSTENEDIQIRITANEEKIGFILKLHEIKDKLSPDSIIQIRRIIDTVLLRNNNNNIDDTESILGNIWDFKTKVEKTSDKCLSDLQNITKSLTEEGEEILDNFSELLNSASLLEQTFEELKERINSNNHEIGKLIGMFDEKGAIIQISRNKYDSLFNALFLKSEQLQIVLSGIDENFENKKFSRWYFEWVKQDLLSDINYLEQLHDSIKTEFDSISEAKSLALKEFNYNLQVKAQQEFEKNETGFASRIDTLKTKIEDSIYEPFPYFYSILVIIIISILIFGLRVYIRAISKKVDTSKIISQPEKKPAVSSIKLQHTEKKNEDTGKGLANVLEKSKSDFLELDLSDEWENSSVAKLYFRKDCIIKTYRFFEDSIRSVDTESKANETGGYLIGQWDISSEDPTKYDVSLEDFIEPGDDATFSKYQLNFGAKIGVKLQKVLDNFRQKTQRDFVMTAWFHSHPGLKIFLSDYDINVQEDFSRNDHKHRMLALVLDPYTPSWDMGIFSYRTSGEMNNAADSKRFFSFDSMYKWAINSGKNSISDKYFTYNLLKVYPGTKIKKVYISNPGILALKRYLEDKKIELNQEPEIAFIEGQKILHDYKSNDILVEGIIEIENESLEEIASNSSVIGCIVCSSCIGSDSDKSLINKLKAQIDSIENIQIAIVYDIEDQIVGIHPFVKDFEKDLQKTSTDGIPLPDLVDWTRKRD